MYLQGCQGLTLFQVALKKVHEIVLYRLVFGVEEDLAIIFFNARVRSWICHV